MKRAPTLLHEDERGLQPSAPAAAADAWDPAVLARELREGQDARRAERARAQRDDEERLRALAIAVPAWWPEFVRAFRAAAEAVGDLVGEDPRSYGPARIDTAWPGRVELVGAHGRLKVTLLDSGDLLIERRCFGSGYDVDLRLEPTAGGGITPSPAAAVREIFEPWITQIGRAR
jgi:hypothetical protein